LNKGGTAQPGGLGGKEYICLAPLLGDQCASIEQACVGLDEWTASQYRSACFLSFSGARVHLGRFQFPARPDFGTHRLAGYPASNNRNYVGFSLRPNLQSLSSMAYRQIS